MEPESVPFDSAPEFQHFKDVMGLLLAVPKSELDKLVRSKKKRSAKRRAGRQKA